MVVYCRDPGFWGEVIYSQRVVLDLKGEIND